MFNSDIYINRRNKLRQLVNSGIAVFIGNNESPFNYPSNAYHFRQDSTFLYYFGIDLPNFSAIIDFDSGTDTIYGNDFIIGDIIWMGPQPTVAELSERAGILNTRRVNQLTDDVNKALSSGRKIHFLPPYRSDTKILLGSLINKNPLDIRQHSSVELIKAVVEMRSVKEDIEIAEIEKALDIAYNMHTTAMKMCKPGVKEQEIFGIIEGIALSEGAGVSFPTILSVNGQTLHNHSHNNILTEGKLMLVDAGAESMLHYASDITRTTPVGGKFDSVQRDIYDIVLRANVESIAALKPGLSNRDIHFLACRVIAGGLKDIGIMKGDTDEAVDAGAHALFMPHGIGHMLGLDVHDMEGLGEDFVGYGDKVKRSKKFGAASLRFAMPYMPGHVFTIEPGCYFIPELISMWRAEGRFTEFINYDAIEGYMRVGGIRTEDNVLITDSGSRVLGRPIPKSVDGVGEMCGV